MLCFCSSVHVISVSVSMWEPSHVHVVELALIWLLLPLNFKGLQSGGGMHGRGPISAHPLSTLTFRSLSSPLICVHPSGPDISCTKLNSLQKPGHDHSKIWPTHIIPKEGFMGGYCSKLVGPFSSCGGIFEMQLLILGGPYLDDNRSQVYEIWCAPYPSKAISNLPPRSSQVLPHWAVDY